MTRARAREESLDPRGSRRPASLAGLRARLRRRRLRSLDLGALELLARTGEARIVYGNRVRLLLGGVEAFGAIEKALAGARSTISIEMYLWRDDRLGRRLASLLAERARAGVQVRVIYDAFGSHGSEAVFVPVREAGGEVVAYAPLRALVGRLWPGMRDHRKLILVDGRVAFVGSRNVGEEYTEEFAGERAFRDLTVAIEGPAVRECLRLFARSWLRHGPDAGDPALLAPLLAGPPPAEAGMAGVPGPRDEPRVQGAPHDAQRAGRDDPARPPRDPLRARLLLPRPRDPAGPARRGSPRGPRPDPAAREVRRSDRARGGTSFYGRLLRSGVEVRERRRRMLHMKAGIIDGEAVIAGSANLDTLSLFRNKELSVNILDPGAAAQLRAALEEDLSDSDLIRLEDWNRRGRVARLVERFAAWLRAWY